MQTSNEILMWKNTFFLCFLLLFKHLIIYYIKVKQWLESPAHHEEEWLVHLGQDVDGVGGDRLSSGTPGQSVEPRLADDVQVGADVH